MRMKWTSIFEAYSSGTNKLEQLNLSWKIFDFFFLLFFLVSLNFFLCVGVFLNRLDGRRYVQYVRF